MTSAPSAPSVVLTGGCGFIGRTVLAALRRRDCAVTVLDRAALPVRWRDDPGVTALQGELTDPDLLAEAVNPVCGEVDAIVHLAAVTSVLGSVDRPAETFRTNVDGTQQLLELARRHEIGSFVLASTNAVVGDVGSAVIRSDSALTPLTPYGATKAAAEMLAFGYAGSYGLRSAVLRLTNVYGPGMEAKDSFVPRLMRAALNGDAVRVYGTGQQTRDLVNVADVADAILLALDRRPVGRMIIGSGRSVSVLDLVELVREVTGAALPVEHVAAPEGEMPAVRVDISASAEILGYHPRVDLREGLAEVWADFRSAVRSTG